MKYPKVNLVKLHTLPECEPEPVSIDVDKLVELTPGNSPGAAVDRWNQPSLVSGVRLMGEFRDKALLLNDNYDWTIGRDSLGKLVAIPTRK